LTSISICWRRDALALLDLLLRAHEVERLLLHVEFLELGVAEKLERTFLRHAPDSSKRARGALPGDDVPLQT
jgi:hypothetical protein